MPVSHSSQFTCKRVNEACLWKNWQNSYFRWGVSTHTDIREISAFHGDEYEDDSLWDVAPLCLVEVRRRLRDVYYLHHHGDDGGSTHLWNVGLHQRHYTVLTPILLRIHLCAVRSQQLLRTRGRCLMQPRECTFFQNRKLVASPRIGVGASCQHIKKRS
jgi:hypothetical protein